MSSALEPGKPRQQIEVGDEQPVGVGNPVGDGDDDVADRIGRGSRDQPLAQHVLVAAARLAHAALVVAKRVGQKPRLRRIRSAPRSQVVRRRAPRRSAPRTARPAATGGAADRRSAASRRPARAAAETTAPAPPHRRRARAAACAMTSRSSAVSRRGGFGEPRVQARRTARRASTHVAAPSSTPAAAARRRASGQRRAVGSAHGSASLQRSRRGGRPEPTRERDDGAAEGVQVGDADQPRPAGRDHLS